MAFQSSGGTGSSMVAQESALNLKSTSRFLSSLGKAKH